MARNKLSDLNDHLFAQLERLGDEDINSEQLEKEISRAKAISSVAKNITENARITLDVLRYTQDHGTNNIPRQLSVGENTEEK